MAKEDKKLPVSAYVVLGLVEKYQGVTAYGLKKVISGAIGNFWKIGHPQVYAVTKRLSEEGYLAEVLEETGRRRRSFRLTRKGKQAFDAWMSADDEPIVEFRNTGTLRLYFSDGLDDERMLEFARRQERWHEEQVDLLEELGRSYRPEGYQFKSLEMGLLTHRTGAGFWRDLAEEVEERLASSHSERTG